MCNHIAEVRHAIFLSIILGGVAALPSTCIIIAIDFSMNIYEGFKIVRKHKKGLESKLILFKYFDQTVNFSSQFRKMFKNL